MLLSICLALQVVRTRAQRNCIEGIFRKVAEQMINIIKSKSLESSDDKEFNVSINDDYIRLQQISMMMDPDFVCQFAETFNQHIWVLLINTTRIPFFTSDNPIARIPHKYDKYKGYSGYASEGIELAYPISSKYLVNIYDSKMFDKISKLDRNYLVINDEKEVLRLNIAQRDCCNRCVFTGFDDFSSIM